MTRLATSSSHFPSSAQYTPSVICLQPSRKPALPKGASSLPFPQPTGIFLFLILLSCLTFSATPWQCLWLPAHHFCLVLLPSDHLFTVPQPCSSSSSSPLLFWSCPCPSSLFSSTCCSSRQCSAVCAQPLQLCPALCNLMDRSPPGSSVHGILQARVLQWVSAVLGRGTSLSVQIDWSFTFWFWYLGAIRP